MPQYFPYNPNYVDVIPELNVASDISKYSPYGSWGIPPIYLEMNFWYYPPLYYLLISPFAMIGNIQGVFMVLLIFQYFTLLMVYLISEKLSRGSGLLGVTALSIIPTWWESFTLLRPDVVMTFFMVLTLYLYFNNKKKWALFASMLGINVKYSFGCVFFSVFPLNYIDFIIFMFFSFLALLPYGIWALFRTGSFLSMKRYISGPAFQFGEVMRSLPNWLPDKYTLGLLSVVFLAIFLKKISFNKKNLGILLVALSNLILYYISGLRVYYYLVPTTVFLCILISEPMSTLISHFYLKFRELS